MNGDTITDLDLSKVIDLGRSGKVYSHKTKRHMGTTIYYPGMKPENPMDVDCEYFDCGTPEKLKIAREHYGL